MQVEGHESAVLRGVDWSRVRIDHILCEQGCDSQLRPMRYQPTRLPGSSSTERLWTHPSVLKPQRKG